MQGNTPLTENLFSFTGRINRAKFWAIWVTLLVINLVVSLIVALISKAGSGAAILGLIIQFIILIPIVWVSLAMQAKRWHDRNKSAWMILINFIPVIGWIWLLIELGFLKGTEGSNRFGEDPLG